MKKFHQGALISFNSCPSLPSVETDDRKQFQCLNKFFNRVHTKKPNYFSRTFQGPPTRNIISHMVQKCTFPVYSYKALRLDLFASTTSLNFSVHLSVLN